MTDNLTPDEFDASEGVGDWRVVSQGASAFFRTDSFRASAAFVQAIATLPRMGEPGTGVDVRHDGVTVRLLTQSDDWWGPSTRDVEAARRISAIAREQRLVPDTTAIQDMLIVPGGPDTAAIMPFWRAVLGYELRWDSPEEDLVDAHDRGPAFWFEGVNQPGGGRRRRDPPGDLGALRAWPRPASREQLPPAVASSEIAVRCGGRSRIRQATRLLTSPTTKGRD